MIKKKKYGKVQVKNFKWIYAFLLPTIIIFVMFYVQPIVVMLTTSFTKWDGFNDPAFNGISNYIKLFTNSASAASIKNLILWSVIAMTFHVGFGVLTAFVLYLKPHGWKFTRSVFMIPNIISAAAWALIYRFIFNDQMGVLNSVIRVFNKDFSVQWFYQSPYAFWAVTLTPYVIGVNVHTGEPMICLTGVIEQHITSDIIFALWQYYAATDDQDFMDRYGYEMTIETARFWNSRLEWIEENNRYEIRDVIGPDEYKEHVDNNAYTNYMAHENMRLAAQVIACIRDEKKDIYGKMQKLMQEEGTSLEQLEEELKDKMKKLYLPQPDEKTGIIPQFDGYFDLKEIDLSVYKNASVVGTVFHDYSGEDVQGMQAGKQADIVELLYQMEDITTPDNKAKNYVYYEARTLHDSSLSKAIHSITACDLGMEKEAYEMFMSAALTDLGQEMKSSDAGIHSANMGGVWQDVVMGFGGIRIRDGHLRIAPNCPKQWEKFTYPLYWKGNELHITVCKDGVEVINEGEDFEAEIMDQRVTVSKGKNEFRA